MKISHLRAMVEMMSPRRATAAALAAAMLSSCASATIEDAVPQGALPSGPVDTGRYPNLNIPRPAATEQMTGEERAAMLRELTRAREAQKPEEPPNAAAEEARLRRLAESHGEEVLREIESGSQ